MKERGISYAGNASRLPGPLDAVLRVEIRDDLVQAVRDLADGSHPGILATVDERGFPRMRWMASLACDDFPCLYAPSKW